MAASEKDIHREALEAYETALEAARDNRIAYLEDYRFARLNEQWPEEIKKQRSIPGMERPMLTLNKLPAFIKQVVNDIRQNRPAIKCRPADSGADIETALVLSGLIRNIEYNSNAAIAYDTAAECAVSGNHGYWTIDIQYTTDDSFDQDILIKRVVNPLSIVGDPYSTAGDSTDWNIGFECELLTRDQFKLEYPDADPISFDSVDDKVRRDWTDGDDVLVAGYWKRYSEDAKILLMSDRQVIKAEEYQGVAKAAFDAMGITVKQERVIKVTKVKKCILNGQQILTDKKQYDWPGKYIPIVPVYGEELNIEGKRVLKSMIHDAKDAQRQFNYWETTATELVALAPRVPFIGPKGAFKTDPRWQTANTANHAFLEYDGAVPPQRMPVDAGPAMGAMTQAKQSSDNIKAILGMYDAALGNRSNETSGKAIQARQRESDVSQFHFSDNLMRAIRCSALIIMDLIPSVYTAERIVRVLGEDGQMQNVQLGQGQRPPQEQDGQDHAPPRIGALQGVFDLTMGKYDIVVEAGPSYTTQRQETVAQIGEFLRSYPEAGPIIGDILVTNMDWKGADEIARRLKKMLPPQLQDNPQQQIPPQVQQMIEQGQELIGQLTEENQKLKADVANGAAAMAKVEAERSKIDLEKQRIPVEKLEKEIDLLTAQKELLTAQANLEKVRGEIAAGVQETKSQIAAGQNEQVNAVAPMLLQALDGLRAEVIRPKRKVARMQKQPDGSYLADVLEQADQPAMQ